METKYFKQAEGTLAYSDYGGDGKPVVMVPGLGALRSEYRFLAPELKKAGYRAIMVDLRGQGESSVPWETYDIPSVGGDVIALIKHINAGPAQVIGASFAAGSAVWAAVEEPDIISSLTLISGSVRDIKMSTMMKILVWLMMNNPWWVNTWIMYYKTLYPARKPDDFEDYLKKLKNNLKQKGRFTAAVGFATCSRIPSEERLSQVKVPTLLIMGTKDPDNPDPRTEGEYVAQKTNGKLELIEGTGHYPQTEMPEATTPIILDFLENI